MGRNDCSREQLEANLPAITVVCPAVSSPRSYQAVSEHSVPKVEKASGLVQVAALRESASEEQMLVPLAA